MEYKDTLNLPKTDFPMKADLPKKEPLILEEWIKADIYKQISEQSKGKAKYILHDGPPYANGNIHIGHALNKILKDIVVKYKTMTGHYAPYVPGWDCHGLPIEHALFKELKISKYQISQAEFRKKAHEYAMRFVNTQREQFIRLGVFADWFNPYLTLAQDYEVGILESFKILVEKGYIFRGLKPVNWCCKCETALAEAEVEYEDHTSPSIYVKFLLDDNQIFEKGTYLLIWTTTPWTLLANVAVAIHPDLQYSSVKSSAGNLIIATDLLDHVMKQGGIESFSILKEIKGKELLGLTYSHPFVERKGKVVLAQYVSREDGTGLVHTAPGHGNEDYMTGIKYKLEIVMPVDSRGRFDNSAGEFVGLPVLEANKNIIEKLKTIGALYFDSKIQHSYPHCWRCKSPVIFRATSQWFLNLEHNNLRKDLVNAVQTQVTWIPEAGRERIKAMVELRPDWCLSRQRYWGVPIPALSCKKCGYEWISVEVINKFIAVVAKEGTDSWFTHEIKDFVSQDLSCPECSAKEFIAGKDILDVWFDSGVSHQAVLKRRAELGGVPCSLYLEGSDQHRGWFQASLIPSMCIDGKAPFESVLTHGFVVDGDGRKMSKSLGNVIAPDEIIKNYGVDILRLWVASSDYNEDIRISKYILSRLSEAYRKIRNTARFILSNLYDFNPAKDRVDYQEIGCLDKWIISSFVSDCLVKSVSEGYEKFNFHNAYKGIYDFCNEKLSSLYLDMAKGRLYTYASNSLERRAAQTVIYDILDGLVRVMAPLLVFTAEEIWQCMQKNNPNYSSVHLLSFPNPDEILAKIEQGKFKAKEAKDSVDQMISIKVEVDKLLEEMRSKGEIGSSFDAKINLLTNSSERYTFLARLQSDLPEIFKVSQVEIIKSDTLTAPNAIISTAFSDIAIQVMQAFGTKCVRCWNYSDTVGKNETHNLLCENCLSAIRKD